MIYENLLKAIPLKEDNDTIRKLLSKYKLQQDDKHLLRESNLLCAVSTKVDSLVKFDSTSYYESPMLKISEFRDGSGGLILTMEETIKVSNLLEEILKNRLKVNNEIINEL